MQKHIVFSGLFYKPSTQAVDYYNSRKDLNLKFLTLGNNFEWSDSIKDSYPQFNRKFNEWSGLRTIYDKLDDFDYEYIGWNHYRRMFSQLPQKLEADIYVQTPYPMLFTDPRTGQRWKTDIQNGWYACHVPEVWNRMEIVLNLNDMIDAPIWNTWKKQNWLNAPCMTFLMKKDLFRRMFEDCWNVAEILEFQFGDRFLQLDYDNYQKRQFCFFLERHFSYWCCENALKKALRVVELPVDFKKEFKPNTAKDNRGDFS